MARVLFISEQFIKDNSPINGNLDVKYITTTIDLCQRKYILPILGTALYNEIASQITANTVSANNQTLLEDYIQDALLYYVLSEGIALFTYKIENKSIVSKTSDNSNPIDNETISMLKDMYKDNAEFFAERCTKYLIENASTTMFPLYLDAGNGVDTVHPNNNNYTCGWVLNDEVTVKGLEVVSDKNIYRYYNR